MTDPVLVVLRGNSGSGKTTTAREVRRRYGRGCALLEQDHLRRVVLREHDSGRIGPVAPAFIAATARTALDLGYHVVLEGILHTGRYAAVLRDLIAGHHGPAHAFYLDVAFDETVRRHATRAEPTAVTADDMRGWYAYRDLLGVPGEVVIPQSATFDDAVRTVLHDSGLGATAALTPARCGARTAPPTGGRDQRYF
ncbi:AAA family ATPase [Actinoplanes sp. NPDC051494]|uniref:AAA family ATPase n=1 Tax=Actinoplanes sp. NPDC051494 TaxID=3363907 RepID=UPI003792E84E